MSILKSILHRWNKDSKSYDTLHPETEVSQITDWHSGIMASLASTTLGTVVSAVTTDSVLGKLIKLLLDASGVKYLIDTNGYVCFGSLFGGLIIQWGSQDNGKTSCALPIAFSAQKFKSIGIHSGNNAVITIELWDYRNSLTQTGFKTFYPDGSYNENAEVLWISIGK